MPFLDLTQYIKPQITQIGDMTIHTAGGVLHRADGPAIITSWSQEWYQNGKPHRADGPAKMYLQHPQPRGEVAKSVNGKMLVEWYFEGTYQTAAVLDETTFHTHWHKGT